MGAVFDVQHGMPGEARTSRKEAIMGTRCLTRVYDEQDREILCLYRQFDGYPDGHGKQLAEFLAKRVMVNGYVSPYVPPFRGAVRANGIGDLALQVANDFVDQVREGNEGNFYIYAPGTSDVGEEYVYEVRAGRLTCKSVYDKAPLYDGQPEAFAVKEEED
jgi:hypothetical protein